MIVLKGKPFIAKLADWTALTFVSFVVFYALNWFCFYLALKSEQWDKMSDWGAVWVALYGVEVSLIVSAVVSAKRLGKGWAVPHVILFVPLFIYHHIIP